MLLSEVPHFAKNGFLPSDSSIVSLGWSETAPETVGKRKTSGRLPVIAARHGMAALKFSIRLVPSKFITSVTFLSSSKSGILSMRIQLQQAVEDVSNQIRNAGNVPDRCG